jgi:hypothetical protein
MPEVKRRPYTPDETQITNQEFAKLVEAISRLSGRTILTTVVQPPPLGEEAKKAATAYAAIAASLRTVFETPEERDPNQS